MVSRLEAEGFEVDVLDLTTGFDVTDPTQWDAVGPVDVACLNAGVLGGEADPAEISLDTYRRAMAVNVDGVVLGVRRLARVMPSGGRIVATASLAGLTAMPDDPVYAATKHAVVGFVRSVAPTLERRGIQINAVCPGIADTAMLGGVVRERLDAAGFPIVTPAAVADAVWLALGSGLDGARLGRPAGAGPDRLPLLERSRRQDRRGVVVPPPSLAMTARASEADASPNCQA